MKHSEVKSFPGIGDQRQQKNGKQKLPGSWEKAAVAERKTVPGVQSTISNTETFQSKKRDRRTSPWSCFMLQLPVAFTSCSIQIMLFSWNNLSKLLSSVIWVPSFQSIFQPKEALSTKGTYAMVSVICDHFLFQLQEIFRKKNEKRETKGDEEKRAMLVRIIYSRLRWVF